MPDQLILGVDAAWTEKAPSGVALVRQSGERCSCLGLAPSYEAFLCLAQGQAVDWSAKPTGGTPDAAKLLDAVRVLAGTTPTVVCIDMPLSMDPISGRRRADERVSQVYGGVWCAAHSPSSKRPGKISDQLRMDFASHGYRLATTAPDSWASPCLVEVYPHPAIVRLMNLKRRLEYKVSKASKYWPHTSTAARRQFLVDSLSALRTTLVCKPGLADMLDQLKTCAASGGERGAWRMLDEFKRVSWGPLSSYVHGGHHAIHRSATGFPVPIARDVIRNSNGLLMVALIFVASVDGEGALISSVKEISERYAECLPPLLPIPNS